MAGFFNAFVPLSEAGGGGLAEYGAARDRYQKRQRELEGYRTGIEGLAQSNPQLGWAAKFIEAGAPPEAIFQAVLNSGLMKQQDIESQRQTLLALGQAYQKTNPKDPYAAAFLRVLSGPNVNPSVIEKAWGYFEPKRPADRPFAADDAEIARSIGLDPDNVDNWSSTDHAAYVQAKTTVTNARRPELPSLVFPGTGPGGAPGVINVPRSGREGVGAPSFTPLPTGTTSPKFTPPGVRLQGDAIPVAISLGLPLNPALWTKEQGQEFVNARKAGRYASPILRDENKITAAKRLGLPLDASSWTDEQAARWEAGSGPILSGLREAQARPKVLSGIEASAAIEAGLPLDQSKWAGHPDWVEKQNKALAALKAGREPKLLSGNDAAIARSAGLALDPSKWTPEEAMRFEKNRSSLSSKEGRYFYDPDANQWKWVEKGTNPPKRWTTVEPRAAQAKAKGYITKNIGGESYGINPSTGLVYDLGAQQPEKTGLFASISGTAPPTAAQRLQTIVGMVKANGLEIRRRGHEFFARGSDGKIYSLTPQLWWQPVSK